MNHQYGDLAERIDDNMTQLMNAFCDAAETNSKHIALLENIEAASSSQAV